MRERWRDDNMHSILVSDSVEEARRRAVALVYVLFLVLLILTLTATYFGFGQQVDAVFNNLLVFAVLISALTSWMAETDSDSTSYGQKQSDPVSTSYKFSQFDIQKVIGTLAVVSFHSVMCCFGFYFYLSVGACEGISRKVARTVIAWYSAKMHDWFFMAGKFTPTSVQRHGVKKYLRSRVMKLGIPYICFRYLIGPLTWAMAAATGGFPVTYYPSTGPLWSSAWVAYFSIAYAVAQLTGACAAVRTATSLSKIDDVVTRKQELACPAPCLFLRPSDSARMIQQRKQKSNSRPESLSPPPPITTFFFGAFVCSATMTALIHGFNIHTHLDEHSRANTLLMFMVRSALFPGY